MAVKLCTTLALAGILTVPAQAASLSGPVNWAMLMKASGAREVVEIASPGGSVDISMAIAQIFRERGISVRVTGWCASGCAMIAIGSGRCAVARSGRLVLHAPTLPAGLGVTETARMRDQLDRRWSDWMAKQGVPYDLIDATFTSFGREYELSDYAMKRVGCKLE